ncbi:MAG: hypothetical protein U9P14_06130 [Gemmatimonadota bacterium]|nr:hypothetical protein [Gemmatimonadota bacterium]
MDNNKISRQTLLRVAGEILAEICRSREEEKGRPDKEDLIEYLSARPGRLNLIFLRLLSTGQLAALRRDPEFRKEVMGSLRKVIIGLQPPLLNPGRVEKFLSEAFEYAASEARKDPDLWAARIVALCPGELEAGEKMPFVTMRLLIDNVRNLFEDKVKKSGSLEEIDRAYVFIERELNVAPAVEVFARRAYGLAPKAADTGSITALYRLLAVRIITSLRTLPPSEEKDYTLLALKDLAGTMDLDDLEHAFKKKAMVLADEIMKKTADYEDILELRFFFDQIGERSNKELLSRKTGELTRTLNMRTEGYRLLTKFNPRELDQDSLIELVPTVMAKCEMFVMAGPPSHLNLLMRFYLETACPLFRELKNKPDRVPRLIQNFKRQVGLMNVYRDLAHLTEVIQRKMVLAICGPRMLATRPESILRDLTRLPPEFYPPAVMKTLREIIREKGPGALFTAADALKLLSFYPPMEEEEEEDPTVGLQSAKDYFIGEYSRRKQ